VIEYTSDPSTAKVDLFYVHPCTYHIGLSNNASAGEYQEEIQYCLQTQALTSRNASQEYRAGGGDLSFGRRFPLTDCPQIALR